MWQLAQANTPHWREMLQQQLTETKQMADTRALPGKLGEKMKTRWGSSLQGMSTAGATALLGDRRVNALPP